jgi:hypothetical protein
MKQINKKREKARDDSDLSLDLNWMLLVKMNKAAKNEATIDQNSSLCFNS